MKVKNAIFSLIMAVFLAACGNSDQAFTRTYASFSSSGYSFFVFDGKKSTYTQKSHTGETIEVLECANCENKGSDSQGDWIHIGDEMLKGSLEEDKNSLVEKRKMQAKDDAVAKASLSQLARFDGNWIGANDGSAHIEVLSISHHRADLPVKIILIDSETGEERDHVPLSFTIEGNRLSLSVPMREDRGYKTFDLNQNNFQMNCVSCENGTGDLILDFTQMTDISNVRRLASLPLDH